MRTTRLWFSSGLGIKTLGLLTLMTLGGCGQLWRPFLEPADCVSGTPACDSAPASDGGMDPIPIPPDLSIPTWQPEPSTTTQNLYGIWGANFLDAAGTGTIFAHTQIWAVGAAGTVVVRFSDSGAWKRTSLTTVGNLYAVSGRSVSDVLVVGELQVSAAWNGMSWAVSLAGDMAAPPSFLSVTPSATKGYVAVGRSDSLVNFDGLNRSIPPVISKLPAGDLTSVYAYASGTTSYIGTSGGEILKYVGTDVASYGLKLGRTIQSIWLRSADDGWAVGDGGLVLHFDGNSWTLVMVPQLSPQISLRSVGGNDKGEVWAVGDAGTILHFDGKSWGIQQDRSLTTLRGVWVDPLTGGVWAVGDLGIILHAGPATR